MVNEQNITLILNIAIGVIALLVLIKALIGLKKGFWKGLISLLVSTILYILVIVFNTKFTDLYYEMNIGQFINATIDINGESIQITTIGNTLREIIISLTKSNTGTSLTPEAIKLCDALAISILSFVIFIIHIIMVAFIIAPIISAILYHLILKPILGEKITKNHKLRIAGFFTYGVKAMITTSLLVVPFSSIANQLVIAVDDKELEGNAKYITDYANAYNNSLFAKVFSGFKINGKSLDVYLIDFATTVTYDENGNKSSFLDEVGAISKIFADGLEQGVIDITDLSNVQIDYIKALSSVFVTNTLNTLSSSPLITALFPVVLSIVSNNDSIKSYVDLTSVDWNSIDWGDELNTLSSVYETFYKTGIVEKFFDTEELYNYELTRDSYTYFKETFEKIDDSSALSQIMPYVFASFASYFDEGDFSGILSTDPSDYKDIKIGEELITIYDSLMTISDFADYIFDDSTIVDTQAKYAEKNNEEGRFLKINDLINEDYRQKIVDFLLTQDAVTGEYVENDNTYEFMSSDGVNKINTVSLFNGVYDEDNNEVYKGILDSKLLSNKIGSLLKWATSSNEEIKKYNLSDVIDDISKIKNYDWKNEIDSLLNIVSIVFNNDNLKFDENFDIFDQNVINELKKITPFLGKSDIAKRSISPIMNSLLGEKEIMGLSVNDLTFNSDDKDFDLANEFDKLLNIMPNIGNLTDNLDGFSFETLFDENSTFANDLNNVLEGIYNSKILNNDTNENELNNFEKVIKNLMGNLQDAGFKELSDEELLNIRKNTGWVNDNSNGEINNICNALASVKDMKSIKKFINPNGEELSLIDLDTQELDTLITSFASSRVIENSMGNICNKYFATFAKNAGVEVDFENVDNWDNESENFCKVIDLMKSISNKHGNEETSASFSLSNINLSSLRYSYTADGIDKDGVDDLCDMLKSVYKLQCIQEKNSNGELENKFGDIVYDFSKNILSSLITDENDLMKVKTDCNSLENKWDQEDGSIDKIRQLLKFILNDEYYNEFFDNDNLDFNKIFNDLDGNIPSLRILLKDLSDIYMMRSTIEPILKNNTKLNINEINSQKLYFEVFSNEYDYLSQYNVDTQKVTTRDQEIYNRKKEIDNLFNLYEEVSKLNSFSGEGIYKFRNVEQGNDKIATIKNILQDCHNSLIFTKCSPTYLNDKENIDTNTSIFEDVIYYVLDVSTVKTMIGDGINDEKIAKSLIKDITNEEKIGVNEQNEDINLNWNNEIDNLCTALSEIVNMNDKDNNPITDINDASKITPDSVQGILTSLNKSYLLHGAVSNAVNAVYTNLGITKYSLDNPIDAKSIDKKSILFNEKVALWNEDIEHITNLFNSIGDKSIEDFKNIKNSDSSVNSNLFSTILPEIASMHNIENNTSDIIYGLFNDVGLSTYILRDRIDTLTSNVDWNFEANKLDNVTNLLLNLKDKINDNVGGLNVENVSSIVNVIEATYDYNQENELEKYYTRGQLASEIVSSLLKKMLEGADTTIDYSFKDGKVGEFSNMNKYEQNGLIGTIKMVQDIEKLNNILNRITANPFDTEAKNDLNEWKKTDSIDKFYNHMSMMGRKETENVQEKNTYLGQDNSKIAEILYTKLIKKANFDNAIVKNINWNLNGKTFEDKALEIITEMNKYSI